MAYIISVNSNNHTNVSIYFERSNGHFPFETTPSYFAFAKNHVFCGNKNALNILVLKRKKMEYELFNVH